MDSTKNTQTNPANAVDSTNDELRLDVRRARTIRTGIKAGLVGTVDTNGRTRSCGP